MAAGRFDSPGNVCSIQANLVVHTRQMSLLGTAISSSVIPEYLSLNVKQVLVFDVIF